MASVMSNFWDEFVLLFADMGVAAGICLVLGLILCIIEIFQPGFGIFGALGTILILAGIIIRMIQGGSLLMLFIMVFLIIVILLGCFLIMVRSMKYGWLSRTSLVLQGTAVNEEFSDGTKNHNDLIGKEGIANTPLRPSGKAEIDGVLYDVVAQSSFIDKGKKVVVLEIEGVRIVVKES